MKKYKLTSQDMTTHRGHKWEVGVKQTIKKLGNELCSDDVFHFYDSPELAIILNSVHADIRNPRLWEVDCDQVAHDGLKGGAKWMTLKKEIAIPKITKTQKIAFAIICAKDIARHNDPAWLGWAEKWLFGEDRSVASAKRAMRRGNGIESAAAWAATEAATSAAGAEWTGWAVEDVVREARAAISVAEISKLLLATVKKAMQMSR